jgi:amino acid adenylation domain-containing protein
VADRFSQGTSLVWREAGQWVSWTYAELADRAGLFAAGFVDAGIEDGEAVGLVASRHPDTIAAMLGLLHVGAQYLPIDPDFPANRIEFLLRSAGVRQTWSAWLVSDADRWPGLPAHLSAIATATPVPPVADADRGERAAYIMFTSGSTGEPKGVVVPHRAILRLVDEPNFMKLNSRSVFLHLAPLSFDASTLEIWGPLLNGGQLVLYPDHELPTASGLKSVIRAASVNRMWLTSSLLNRVVDQDVDALSGLEELLAGGEALSVPHVLKLLSALPETQLINGYGPTENTTFTTCFRIPSTFAGKEAVPIGMPITGTDVLLVDDALQPVADAEEGELIALGDGLALGYLNRPDLTEERFVEIRDLRGEMRRGYRTGDRVCRGSDGLYRFLGRFDDQVKIDGHRIEPGEIEAAISGLHGISQNRVLVRVGPAGQKRLVAYYVTDTEVREASLRNALLSVLPPYMVPHYIFCLDSMPTNANGKLDKAALPDPFLDRVSPVHSAADGSVLGRVRAAWVDVLGQSVPDDRNFFDAGGTSLEAVRLYEVLGQRFDRELPPTFVFEATTIRRQAEFLQPAPFVVSAATVESRGSRRRAASARTRGRK